MRWLSRGDDVTQDVFAGQSGAGMMCNGELSSIADKVHAQFTGLLVTCGFARDE